MPSSSKQKLCSRVEYLGSKNRSLGRVFHHSDIPRANCHHLLPVVGVALPPVNMHRNSIPLAVAAIIRRQMRI